MIPGCMWYSLYIEKVIPCDPKSMIPITSVSSRVFLFILRWLAARQTEELTKLKLVIPAICRQVWRALRQGLSLPSKTVVMRWMGFQERERYLRVGLVRKRALMVRASVSQKQSDQEEMGLVETIMFWLMPFLKGQLQYFTIDWKEGSSYFLLMRTTKSMRQRGVGLLLMQTLLFSISKVVLISIYLVLYMTRMVELPRSRPMIYLSPFLISALLVYCCLTIYYLLCISID